MDSFSGEFRNGCQDKMLSISKKGQLVIYLKWSI